MNFFEECVSSFDSMREDLRSISETTWREISLSTQEKKLDDNRITDHQRRFQILKDLQQRPQFLVHLAQKLRDNGVRMKTFAEVGTAQGLQSITFARAFKDSNVYTCDIKDDRSPLFKDHPNIEFVSGESTALSKKIKSKGDTVDMFWIDGAHDSYSVIDDFLSLQPRSTKDTVWAFDDYDTRFGCFKDLNVLIRHFEEHIVLDLGQTASGNPNRIVVVRGFQ